MEMAGRFGARHHVDWRVIQFVAHNPVVAPICDEQNRIGGIAQIDHIAVRIVGGLDRYIPRNTRLTGSGRIGRSSRTAGARLSTWPAALLGSATATGTPAPASRATPSALCLTGRR